MGKDVNAANLQKIAQQTGGKYYFATEADKLENEFKQVQSNTIDYVKDSNNDGISDYYTKLICDGKLTTGAGQNIFKGASYEEVQANDDYDHDGLKNGEEVKVTNCGDKVYLTYKSDPTDSNADNDAYSDSDEVKQYRTCPLVSNAIFKKKDLSFVNNNESYMASKFVESYDKDPSFNEDVMVGNVFFGSVYDKTIVDERMLIDYFTKVNKKAMESNSLKEVFDVANKITNVAEKGIGRIDAKYRATHPDEAKTIQDLQRYIYQHKGKLKLKDIGENGVNLSKEEVYKYTKELVDKYNKCKKRVSKRLDNLKMLDKIDDIGRVRKKVSRTFAVVDIGFKFLDGWYKYNEYKAQLRSIKDNIYVLDDIINKSSDESLVYAAQSIKDVAYKSYNNEFSKMDNYKYAPRELSENEFMSWAVDYLIGSIPVAGPFIVLGKELYNMVTNIDKICEETTKLYAIGATSNIVNAESKNFINNNAISVKGDYRTTDGYTSVYNNASLGLNKFINAEMIREFTEEQFKTTLDAFPWLIKWICLHISNYVTEKTDNNINRLKEIDKIYTKGYVLTSD